MRSIQRQLWIRVKGTRLLRALLLGLALVLGLALTGCTLVGITRITYSTTGTDSKGPSLSADGRRIAFSSDSDFFNQSIPGGQLEIWLYDSATLTYTRITTGTSSDCDSSEVDISGDGTAVAFRSDCDFLGQGIVVGQEEIWVVDLATMDFTRVTTSSDGTNRRSEYPSLNYDGTTVAFDSDSALQGHAIAQNESEIWVVDLPTMRYTRITTVAGPGLNRYSKEPDLSDDGTKVAFYTRALAGYTIDPNTFEIFVYDLNTGQYTRVTTASDTNRRSQDPSLSGDGTKVAFRSDSDLAGYTIPDDQDEVWLVDLNTMQYTRVTTATGSGSRNSYKPSLNQDGARLAFYGDADVRNSGLITDNQNEIWLYDATAVTYTLVSWSSVITERDSRYPSISANGTMIAFESDSDMLNEGLADGETEVWLYDKLWRKVYLPVTVRNN